MIQHIYLVRHGQTDFNAEKRIQGQGASSHLSHKGMEQAEKLSQRLQSSGFTFDYIVSSPLERALETAKIATKHLTQEILLESLVMEISCGELEGKLFSEIDPDILSRMANNLGEKYPGGESSLDVRNRGLQFLDKIKEWEGNSLIVFSHGNFLRNLAGAATGLPPEMFLRVTKDNTAISYLARHGESNLFRIVTWNDSSHLHTIPPLKL